MTKVYRLLWTALLAVCLSGCNEEPDVTNVDLDDIFSTDGLDVQKDEDAMKVIGVKFTPDYKQFTMQVGMVHDMGPYSFSDTSAVSIKTYEKMAGIVNETRSKPVLIEVRNTEGEDVARRKIKMLVLVDLAQPQYVVDKELAAVKEMKTVFTDKNLYLSFMYGENMSETMEASDYVLNTYFKSQPDQYKYLYRSMLAKKQEMTERKGVWADAKKMNLVVFSDEEVYDEDNDEPIDPQHFELQGTLVNDTIVNDTLSISSVSFRSIRDDMVDPDQAQSALMIICKNSGGVYQNYFEWTSLKKTLIQSDQDIILANEFVFENPKGKVYRGNPHTMRIEIYDKQADSLLGAATASIFLGSPYSPVIVDEDSKIEVFIQGLLIGLLLLLLVYGVFQFIIPFIRYRLFKKKYVLKYQPGNMSVDNVFILESCYYCKAPFKTGDEIVAKCEHVMHKQCWEENGYHCPEHGRRCKTGSHYYNAVNLFDLKNASFYMKWVLVAIFAAMCAWFVYLLYSSNYNEQLQILEADMKKARIAEVGELALFNVDMSVSHFIPSFGLILGFFLTLALSCLAVRRRELKKQIVDVAVRAIIVGVCAYVMFFLFNDIVNAFQFRLLSALLEWIPWTLTALMIAFVSTVGTRIKMKKYVLIVTIVLGILSMNLWSYFYRGISQLDIRVMLLFTFIFFSVGLAIAVAEMSPKSERYFLNVKGAVKEMDVALYKWFLNHPNDAVTIGKSIDCSLQLSWDIKSDVAPVQAEVRLQGSGIRLTAVEDGVMVGKGGKALPAGQSIWLYHNSQFRIGDTTFTYVERDR